MTNNSKQPWCSLRSLDSTAEKKAERNYQNTVITWKWLAVVQKSILFPDIKTYIRSQWYLLFAYRVLGTWMSVSCNDSWKAVQESVKCKAWQLASLSMKGAYQSPFRFLTNEFSQKELWDTNTRNRLMALCMTTTIQTIVEDHYWELVCCAALTMYFGAT